MFFLISGVSFVQTAPAEPVRLDLNGTYERALVQSETLAISEEAIRSAEARYWQALSAVLPGVSLVLRHRIENEGAQGFGGGGGGNNSFNGEFDSDGPVGTGFGGGRSDSQFRTTAQIEVTQTLFSGFRDYHLLGAVRADRQAASSQVLRDRETLFLDVSDLFFQVLSQEEDLRILQELDQALNKRVKELGERVDLGRSRTSELLAARTELVDNQAIMEQSRGLISASRELLAFLIGRPAETFVLVDEAPENSAKRLADYLLKVGSRADLEAQQARVISGEKQVSAARARFWPTVDFEFNWTAFEEPDEDEEWSIFFTAELPLFDGGLRAGELAASKSQARVSRLTLERLRRLAEYDVRLAYSNFKATAAQLIRLREADQVASENLQAQQEDYRLGRASNLDVLNALIRRQDVRRNLAGADFQSRANLNALHVAAGQLPGDE